MRKPCLKKAMMEGACAEIMLVGSPLSHFPCPVAYKVVLEALKTFHFAVNASLKDSRAELGLRKLIATLKKFLHFTYWEMN